jgi:hypothetical protein
MRYHVATKEEAVAFWKERKKRPGDGVVVSIPIMSGRRRLNQVKAEKGKPKKNRLKPSVFIDSN